MRLAATTYSFREFNLEEALDCIAAAGLDDVEVWLPHARDDFAGARRALDERGLRAAAVCIGGIFSADDAVASRGSELAAAIDARLLVACVAPAVLHRVVEELPTDLTLCVENHWDQPLATARDLRRALATESRAAACLDTGHALAAGEDPCGFARAMAGGLGHVHLKDAQRASVPERLARRRLRRRLGRRPAVVLPGAGALDARSFHRMLRELGYRGAVSIEYEGPFPAPAVAAAAASWRRAELDESQLVSSRTGDTAVNGAGLA